MKKIMIVLLQMFFAVASESQTTDAIQQNCETGTAELFAFVFKSTVFHPSDFPCERGFRMSFETGCWKNTDTSDAPCIFADHRVKIMVVLYETYARCFFPLALTQQPGYVAKDSALLTVEKSFRRNRKGNKIIFIPGNYNVYREKGALVTDIPIQMEITPGAGNATL